MRRSLFLLVSAILTLLVTSACRRGPWTTAVYDEKTHQLIRIDYDYNRDGRVDVRTYMKNGHVERLEGDADGDGRVDRWEYYDEHGTLLRVGGSTQHDGVEDTWAYTSGDDVRLEISTRRDGVVDRREFYHANVLTKTESDTNHDGLMDTWEQYENGRLAVLLIDDGGHGKPTRRLTYAPGGAVTVEADPSGEGHFLPVVTTPAASKGQGRVPR